jgi:hypothetical protein
VLIARLSHAGYSNGGGGSMGVWVSRWVSATGIVTARVCDRGECGKAGGVHSARRDAAVGKCVDALREVDGGARGRPGERARSMAPDLPMNRDSSVRFMNA